MADDMFTQAGVIQELVVVGHGLMCLSGNYVAPMLICV